MARVTVAELMRGCSAIVNQDVSVPADGSTDWVLWLHFINRSQVEFAESFDWEILKKVYMPAITPNTANSVLSIGLPLDFRKLAGPVVNYATGVDGGESWPEILPEKKLLYYPQNKYFYVQGDISGGYSLQWSPGTLSSGASIEINYYSMPTSLVSSTQYPVVPDSDFLTQRTIAYVLEARSDPRYQDEERKAREKLLLMIENSSISKYSSYVSPQPVGSTLNTRNLRIGKF